MDNIHFKKQENVIISKVEPIFNACPADEIEIRPIDANDTSQILMEIERLTALTTKYNKYKDEPREHIKRQDYESVSLYKAAKDLNRKDYYDKCHKLEGHITLLRNKNTALCRERVEKKPKVYTHDEMEYLKQRNEKRAQQVRNANAKYYESNRDKIQIKRQIKKQKEIIKETENIDEYNRVLIKTNKIIHPLCVCGRRCNIIDFKSVIKHSNIVKHKLFKSVIALIHYWRRNGTVKNAINKINNNFIDFKRVVREGTVTLTNKTDKEIIDLYNAYLQPIDENKTHQPRPSYITRREYSKKHKENIEILSYRINKQIQ